MLSHGTNLAPSATTSVLKGVDAAFPWRAQLSCWRSMRGPGDVGSAELGSQQLLCGCVLLDLLRRLNKRYSWVRFWALLARSGAAMNIDLKGVTFSLLLAFLGVALILIAAAQGLSIAGATIQVPSLVFRVVLIATGFLLLTAAVVFQVIDIRQKAPSARAALLAPPTESGPKAAIVEAEDFFLTLDHERVASFAGSVSGAIRLGILARTVVNLVGQNGKSLDDLLKLGAEIRILVVHPASEAAHHVYGNSYELFRQNARTALGHLLRLQERYPDRLHVRFFTFVPTVSIMMVEKRDASESFAQVQMYFIHGAVGRDRPVFRVVRRDRWYEVFREEFESIWKSFPDAALGEQLSAL